MTTARDQIIQTTCDLLENQGYHATGINQIVKESGAPKGSIYYYFPDGKEEISAEAVLFAGKTVSQRIKSHLAEQNDPALAIKNFVETIAHFVEESGFRAGGPLTAVASETATTSPRLNLACSQAYSLMRAAFAEKLIASGWDEKRAERASWMIVSAIEGGIILSRTFHSGDPLRQVAQQLKTLLNC